MTVRVIAFLSDGSQAAFKGDHYLSRYKTLLGQGYEGKKLIHEMLTDNWATPPLQVTIMDGTERLAVIRYV